MNKSFLIKNKIFKIISSSLIFLPTPLNISIMWNFGSILGLMLFIQILTGFFLSMHYCSNINLAFSSIIHIMQDIQYGWLMRNCHANGASLFFISLYFHIGRGLYYSSFSLKNTWLMGVIIYFLSMMTAFMGYILPWGQMSFWGATVITNLISAIPYLGEMIVKWLWGGFSINNATLTRFYSFHFIMPFIILFCVIIHLFFLHEKGSSNSIGNNSNLMKIPFHIYFTLKDLVGFLILWMFLLMLVFFNPYVLCDPDNFIPANSLVTPPHIQPEWYFLFAYTILRSIPSKLGGVIALLLSILILMILPFIMKLIKSLKFNFLFQNFYWMFINIFLILTFLGTKAIEYPFVLLGQIMTFFYFFYFLMYYLFNFKWFNLMY